MSVQKKKMFDTEQQDETYDIDDEFDCEVEEEVKTVKVKEETNSETDCYVLESDDDQSEGNGKWIVLVYPFTLLMLFFCRISDHTARRTALVTAPSTTCTWFDPESPLPPLRAPFPPRSNF